MRKKPIVALALLALPMAIIINNNIDKYSKSSTIENINQCAIHKETFIECVNLIAPSLVQNTPINELEGLWFEHSVKNNWPFCHDALHQIGHYLPDLTPTQLRATTSGACNLGIVMGYAERKINDTQAVDATLFNKHYCKPSFDKEINYSEQCSHISGHLAYLQTKNNPFNALEICQNVRHHKTNCSNGVLMLYFQQQKISSELATDHLGALNRCQKFKDLIDQCLPYASLGSLVQRAKDVEDQSKICLQILKNHSKKISTCADLLSQAFGRLPYVELINSKNICLSYPDRNACTKTILYSLSNKTNARLGLDEICNSELSTTYACSSREKVFKHLY